MPFQKEILTPTIVGNIRAVLNDGNGQAASKTGFATVQLIAADGTVVSEKTYDLNQKLSGSQRQMINDVMTMLRTEAQALL